MTRPAGETAPCSPDWGPEIRCVEPAYVDGGRLVPARWGWWCACGRAGSVSCASEDDAWAGFIGHKHDLDLRPRSARSVRRSRKVNLSHMGDQWLVFAWMVGLLVVLCVVGLSGVWLATYLR